MESIDPDLVKDNVSIGTDPRIVDTIVTYKEIEDDDYPDKPRHLTLDEIEYILTRLPTIPAMDELVSKNNTRELDISIKN